MIGISKIEKKNYGFRKTTSYCAYDVFKMVKGLFVDSIDNFVFKYILKQSFVI